MGIEYTKKDVTADARAMGELLNIVGFPATPTLTTGKEVILGIAVNRRRIKELLA